jgi:amidase/allophanate hydrolase
MTAEAGVSFNSELSFATLAASYAGGARPEDVVVALAGKIAAESGRNAWIHVAPTGRLREACAALEARRDAGEDLPLFGIPFGVKDNIDVAGMPTTAACPDFAYLPERSARSVDLLLAAGAICMGKTNLDQFATGLCGVRSPYGACGSAANGAYVSGGSSSGSAVAVAAGHVSFALGTDTGGSGRIPAGFNGVVGLKPTLGRVSIRGLVPNCRSLDCVSIFAGTIGDGTAALGVIEAYDADDPFSRRPPESTPAPPVGPFRFGRLADRDLAVFGMDECRGLYRAACERLVQAGGVAVEIDFAPFVAAGNMLFEGPWIAERRSALDSFASLRPSSLLDTIRQVVNAADRFSAVHVFNDMHRLAQLKREVASHFDTLAAIVVPTAPRPYTLADMERDPVTLNNRLGHYSYGANLLDLCAIAVPNGVLACGVPMGVTFLAPAWRDESVAALAQRFVDAGLAAAPARRAG